MKTENQEQKSDNKHDCNAAISERFEKNIVVPWDYIADDAYNIANECGEFAVKTPVFQESQLEILAKIHTATRLYTEDKRVSLSSEAVLKGLVSYNTGECGVQYYRRWYENVVSGTLEEAMADIAICMMVTAKIGAYKFDAEHIHKLLPHYEEGNTWFYFRAYNLVLLVTSVSEWSFQIAYLDMWAKHLRFDLSYFVGARLSYIGIEYERIFQTTINAVTQKPEASIS